MSNERTAVRIAPEFFKAVKAEAKSDGTDYPTAADKLMRIGISHLAALRKHAAKASKEKRKAAKPKAKAKSKPKAKAAKPKAKAKSKPKAKAAKPKAKSKPKAPAQAAATA